MGVVWSVQVIDNQVVMVRTEEKDGHFALQIGALDNPKLKNVSHLNICCIYGFADWRNHSLSNNGFTNANNEVRIGCNGSSM